MAELSEILPERIDERLKATGKSKRALSLSIGAHAGYIRDLFDPERFNVPSATRLAAIARELETTTEYLIGDAASPDQVRSEVGVRDVAQHWNGREPAGPPIPLVGTGDCADLEVTATESGAHVAVDRSSFDPDFVVRMVTRPAALLGARNLYAIYFHGESMWPRFEAGEIGIVDPQRPARAGDYVVVQIRENGGDAVTSVLVKRLVRHARGKYVLEQFNPPLTFELPAERVAHVHRIVPNTELLS